MRIERLESGAVTVLRLQGEIDDVGMNELRLALMGCIQDQRVNVVLNMSGVPFVSYMGVGVLVERLRQVRACGGDLRLVGVNLYTQRLFRMVGVTRVFQTCETETQAIQSFQRAA